MPPVLPCCLQVWTAALQMLTNASTALALAYAGVLTARGALDPSFLVSFSQLSVSIGQASRATSRISPGPAFATPP